MKHSRRTILAITLILFTTVACATGAGVGQGGYSRALNALDTSTPMREGRIMPLSPEADIEQIKVTVKNVLMAYQNKNLAQAEALYYQAEELGANDETILFWLGNYSIMSGDVEAARHYYEELLRINPVNAKALYNLATVYLSKAENYFQFYTATVPEEDVERQLLRLLGSIDQFSNSSKRQVDAEPSPLDSLRQLLEQ